MNEEKIDQILKNQKAIMSIISVIHVNTRKDKRDSDIIKSLDKEYWRTIELLNPTKQPTIIERTKDAFVRKKTMDDEKAVEMFQAKEDEIFKLMELDLCNMMVEQAMMIGYDYANSEGGEK